MNTSEPKLIAMQFTARIDKVGINPCVDVPESVSQAFGLRGSIPVQGTVDGHEFRSTLVPLGGGRHRLYINTAMRKGAGVDVGDTVTIEVELDTKPRMLPEPAQLSRALRDNPAAQTAWDALTPSRRKEILSYLNWLKRPESLQRNVEKTLAQLLEGAEPER
jgi:hypothetical protein